ncbi:MAG: ADP-heptose synthase, bifunctional sugar kinase/adenylyltransferase [Verrucomicrobiales bacterium]|nr:ADP-heptose synthase, bifunctional sugar kinase/adenylyltransferase [Verrucomicrobiales bacterium]
MNSERFEAITARYPLLRVAVVGDVCLDRYLEIDPVRQETSIETGLPVHNVVRVRSQPGAAGTILNNLAALGVGEIYPVGFCGEDGEGFELRRALLERRGVKLDFFLSTSERRTFTYCKPLLMHPGKAPEELSRLDSKNWSKTPMTVQEEIVRGVQELAQRVDAIILMDQVDVAETGVVTHMVLEAIGHIAKAQPELLILADSRRGLKGYPRVCFKMNQAELSALTGSGIKADIGSVREVSGKLAKELGHMVFVTLAEKGICGARPDGKAEHVFALPVRGEIDIVGAGDSVTANLTASLAAGAELREALELANQAASIVIHQLGTTGTASVAQLRASF